MAKAARKRATSCRSLPEEIVVGEILARLPPKSLLRCRAVCRATSSRDFLLAHHARQPSLPIFHGDDLWILGVHYHNILAFDSRAATDQLHAVAKLDEAFRPEASCDGLLLLSKVNSSGSQLLSICNPATREHALLGPPWDFQIMGIVAYPSHKDQIGCYVFSLGSDQPPRCIGWPEMASVNLGLPVRLRDCLHWYPVYYQTERNEWKTKLMVFDTVAESFRQMREPPIVSGNSEIFEMDGTLGIYTRSYSTNVIDIRVLQSYESEVWDLKYRIELPVAQIRRDYDDYRDLDVKDCDDNSDSDAEDRDDNLDSDVEDCFDLAAEDRDDHWDLDVVSVGSVVLLLVRFSGWMLHVDSDGKLVSSFYRGRRGLNMSFSGCRLKQSLVRHTFFPALEGYAVNASPFVGPVEDKPSPNRSRPASLLRTRSRNGTPTGDHGDASLRQQPPGRHRRLGDPRPPPPQNPSSVCRAWRRVTSTRDFLLAHHRWQPSLPIFSGHNIVAFDHQAVIDEDRLHTVAQLDEAFHQEASCDGLLVLSKVVGSSTRLSICNPVTREHALLGAPRDLEIMGMYLHRPTCEYRVLLKRRRCKVADMSPKDQVSCYVFSLGSNQPLRYIGWPDMASGIYSLPVCLRDSIHWYPLYYQSESNPQRDVWKRKLIVFDTIAESFRQMREPNVPCNSYIFEVDGALGIYTYDYSTEVMDILVSRNYEREVWDLKYRIQLPVVEIRMKFGGCDGYCDWDVYNDWDFDLVSVHSGLLLLAYSRWLLHVDSDGKLVNSFYRGPGPLISGCCLKQSLVPHTFFPALEGYVVNASPFIGPVE
ncbi:unnamed protein product [Alopecurus aequalis]